MKMATLCLLAVAICTLLPRLQSARIKAGITHEAQGSVHAKDTDMTTAAYHQGLLACKHLQSDNRFIIQGKDKPVVDYNFEVDFLDSQHSSTVDCKPFTPPPKHSPSSAALSNLTTPELPDDVIGVIASFFPDVHCSSCELLSFNTTFLERCRTALTNNHALDLEWAQVDDDIQEEGGSCMPDGNSIGKQSLPNCMQSPKGSDVAVCNIDSESRHLLNIKEGMRKIKIHEDMIQVRQKRMRMEGQRHQDFIKETQEFINKNRESIKDLQDVLRMREQDVVDAKHIFESP